MNNPSASVARLLRIISVLTDDKSEALDFIEYVNSISEELAVAKDKLAKRDTSKRTIDAHAAKITVLR